MNGLSGRVWNLASVLRDAGVSYFDYVEQITFLLFLKLDAENRALGRASSLPEACRWEAFAPLQGDALAVRYGVVLESLGGAPGLVGSIFLGARNKIAAPALLARLVELIGREDWRAYGPNATGDLYESLLQRNAEDVRGGAGQYFTPRPLIHAMVSCVQPKPGMTVMDPACGTGGFLLGANSFMVEHYADTLDRDEKRALANETFFGVDIAESVVRLASMNMFLHGLGGAGDPITVGDSLAAPPSRHFDLVLANPPFGKKSTISVTGEDGRASRGDLSVEREDFWASTGNKQLNFLQHIRALLKLNGSAAVVLPDNVLFEGGAGEVIRRKLLETCDVHTLLRLPTGIFYAQGVKANVVFFTRKPAREEPWTQALWVYDLRTNIHLTLKTNPLTDALLEDFVRCYNPLAPRERQESERFKRYALPELLARDKANLDLFWLRDDTLEESAALPAPDVLAAEIVENLRAALLQFASIEESLDEEEVADAVIL